MSASLEPTLDVTRVSTAPTAAKPNVLAQHGTHGRLIVTLQRYALLGWLAFFVLLVVFIVLIVTSTFAPKPVVVLDENRRIIGTLEYLNGSSRTPQEIQAAAKYVAQNCLSLNADTIDDDVAECMNMMDETLFNHWLELLKGGYVSRIKHAAGRSTIKFDNEGVQLVSQQGLLATVRLTGHLETKSVSGTTNESREQPFDLTLMLKTIARSSVSTRGFQLIELKDN